MFKFLESRRLISDRRVIIFLLFLGYLAFNLPGITAPFVTTGEPREALVAQSMYLHGDLLQSVRYGDELATKPPLLHWFMVAVSEVFGEVNELSARVPSLLAAAFALCVWTAFLIPLAGRGRALLFFIVLATSAEWYRQASHARVDMLLAACVSLALLSLFKWVETEKFKYLGVASLCMAGAALTKGPVGVALPVLVTVAALVFWKALSFKKLFKLAVAGAIAFMPLLFWYAAETWIAKNNLIDIVLHENLARLFGEMSEGKDPHAHGVFYLLGAFFVGLLPWSLFSLGALPAIFKKDKTKEESAEFKRLLEWCVITCLVTLVIFFIPSSKRGVYLLPAYPAMAVLLSYLLHNFLKSHNSTAKKVALYSCGFLTLLWLLLLGARLDLLDFNFFIDSPKTLSKLDFYLSLFKLSVTEFSFVAWSLQLIPLFFSAIFIYGIKTDIYRPVNGFAALLVITLLCAKAAFLLPLAKEFSPKKFIALEISEHQPDKIALHADRMYAEAFYIRQIDRDISVKKFSDDDTFVLLWDHDHDKLSDAYYYHRSDEAVKKPGRFLEFAMVD